MNIRPMLVMMAMALPAVAETEPPALTKLREQRDAAAAKATASATSEYRTGLERLLLRAQQVGAMGTVERIQDTLRRLDGKAVEGKPAESRPSPVAKPSGQDKDYSGIFGKP
ncbi:MAG: hypothetical protein QM755_04820 [Luteolibacter sp.]